MRFYEGVYSETMKNQARKMIFSYFDRRGATNTLLYMKRFEKILGTVDYNKLYADIDLASQLD